MVLLSAWWRVQLGVGETLDMVGVVGAGCRAGFEAGRCADVWVWKLMLDWGTSEEEL